MSGIDDDGYSAVTTRRVIRPSRDLRIIYGDLEGGQRVITRYALTPRDDGSWLAAFPDEKGYPVLRCGSADVAPTQ